jgi:hypothetical protein
MTRELTDNVLDFFYRFIVNVIIFYRKVDFDKIVFVFVKNTHRPKLSSFVKCFQREIQ